MQWVRSGLLAWRTVNRMCVCVCSWAAWVRRTRRTGSCWRRRGKGAHIWSCCWAWGSTRARSLSFLLHPSSPQTWSLTRESRFQSGSRRSSGEHVRRDQSLLYSSVKSLFIHYQEPTTFTQRGHAHGGHCERPIRTHTYFPLTTPNKSSLLLKSQLGMQIGIWTATVEILMAVASSHVQFNSEVKKQNFELRHVRPSHLQATKRNRNTDASMKTCLFNRPVRVPKSSQLNIIYRLKTENCRSSVKDWCTLDLKKIQALIRRFVGGASEPVRYNRTSKWRLISATEPKLNFMQISCNVIITMTSVHPVMYDLSLNAYRDVRNKKIKARKEAAAIAGASGERTWHKRLVTC